jgi:hypothetical protein
MALGAGASSVLADGVVTFENPGAGWRDQAFGGGAFRLNVVSGYTGVTGGPGGGAASFLSFCIEYNEYISLDNTTRYNAHLATSAVGGGLGGGNPDPLDYRTANLYAEFRGANSFGNLAGLGGDGVNSGAETRALQRAIWAIEQEIGNLGDGVSIGDFDNDQLALDLYNWSVAQGNNGIGLVRVLRMYYRNQDGSNGGVAQDQLTIVPLPPAAFAGLGALAGFGGLGWARRRANRA